MIDEGGERTDCHHANPVDRRGLGSVRGRQRDLRETFVARREREAERPADRPHGAVEPELSDEDAARVVDGLEPRNLQKGDGDGEIERGSELAEAGRREVDGDGSRRDREAAVAKRRADPLPGLADARIRQADDREGGEPGRDVDFHVQDAGFDSESCGGVDSGEHGASLAKERLVAR